MEIELENKEVDGIYKNMIPCKTDCGNIRFIYNVLEKFLALCLSLIYNLNLHVSAYTTLCKA
jgi:hypothetical protein